LQALNGFTTNKNQQEETVQDYENIFKIGNMDAVSKVKIKIIEGMVQVEHPINWSIDNIIETTNENN
jgi:hypothetical protein